jgi:uncharacterized protein YegP (UPF0339 family)
MKWLRSLFGQPKIAPGEPFVRIHQTPGIGWNWRLQDGNREVLCSSRQGHGSEREVRQAIDNARDALYYAKVIVSEAAE